MSANKNVNVCVATSPTLLIKVDANHTGQNPPACSIEQRKHHTSAAARSDNGRVDHAAGRLTRGRGR
jgi:hypothetical protein